MAALHAVVWIDHHHAQVLHFDAERVQVRKVQAHRVETRQHGSDVRTEHEFFGEVCDELDDVDKVLVTGSKTPLIDFHHYVDKHCPVVAARIVGWETVDHPSENQLASFAWQYFVQHDRLAAARPPTR